MAAFPLALLPSVVLFAGAYGALVVVGVDVRAIEPPARSTDVGEFIGAVLFAPVVETLLLSLGLKVLLRFTSRPTAAATASALAWGALHATLAPLWFFGTVWSFFVFSSAYLGWRGQSFGHAFASALVPHVLINLSVMVSLAFLPVENAT